VLDGRIEVHTEFYDPVVLEQGESIYIDSQMGHAYVVGDGCEEATVLGMCSSADEDLMSSLMNLHGTEVGEGENPKSPSVRDLRPSTSGGAHSASADPLRRRGRSAS